MDHASASFASPWAAAVLGGHAMGSTNTEHGFGHHGLSMDLHGYSYYRCERISHEHKFKTKSEDIQCLLIYGFRYLLCLMRSWTKTWLVFY